MRRGLAAIILLLAALFPATAGATLVMTGDSTTVPGQVGLTVYASANLTSVEGGELVDGVYQPLTNFALQNAGIVPPVGPLVVGVNRRVAPWRCDRQNRTFEAIGRDQSGNTESATFTVRTPSCKNRIQLDVVPRARPGALIRATVRDSWGAGDTAVRLCRKPPRQKSRCQVLAIPEGQTTASTEFYARTKGRWIVSLGSEAQRIKRVIAVGVKARPQDLVDLPRIVTTGDSMMQSLDTVLQDKLATRANLISDVFIGSGFTKPFIVDWAALPAKQVRANKPDAVIAFLGANESGPLNNIPCCGEPWIEAYAAQARSTMQTWLQGGKGAVIWLTNPVPGDERRVRSMAAVNKAVNRAAQGLDRVQVLDMSSVFTPGGVYRDDMPYEGQTIRVRQDDTIHLSIPGARIASTYVLDALEDLGVIQ